MEKHRLISVFQSVGLSGILGACSDKKSCSVERNMSYPKSWGSGCCFGAKALFGEKSKRFRWLVGFEASGRRLFFERRCI